MMSKFFSSSVFILSSFLLLTACGGGDSGTANTVDTEAPTIPQSVQRVSATQNAVSLKWDASSDNIGVTGYRVYRDSQQIGTATSTTYSDTTVQLSTMYSYTVRAFDAASNISALSQALSVTTAAEADTQAPTAPLSLEENKTKAESISMTWKASTDNVAVVGYNIYRDGQLLESTTELKYKDETVKPSTQYTFTVKSFDLANNQSIDSNAITVTTDELASTVIDEPAGIYNTGLSIVEMKVKVLPKVGNICIEDEYDGCTFGHVLQDIDWKDDFKPEVKVEFSTDDGFTTSATMRQRGGYTRLNPMKSFRVKFEKGSPKWNGEDRVQLIKTFDDPTRTKHKLSYDLFTEINNLPSMRARYVRLTVEDAGQFDFTENPTYAAQTDYQETDMGLYLQVEYFGEEYLERRNWAEDSRVYKPNSFDFKWLPAAFELDSDGKPVDKDAFEAQIEIKEGKDHRAFVEMLQAVNDTTNDFNTVIEQYFDRENYLNWLAVNILTNNTDTIKHNFYLYNPIGTKKFYFVPWDYDYAYNLESTDENGQVLEVPEKPPFWYTHAFRWGHPLHGRFIENVSNVDELKLKVTELRQTVFTDSNISTKLTSYGNLISNDVTNQPDDVWYVYPQDTQVERTAAYNAKLNEIVANVTSNYDNYLKYFDNPMPLYIYYTQSEDGLFQAGWGPSVSLSGGVITYDIIISRTTDFKAADIVKTITGISETDYAEQLDLASGKYFVKMISRDSSDPLVKWQSGSNGYSIKSAGGEHLYYIFGVVELLIP